MALAQGRISGKCAMRANADDGRGACRMWVPACPGSMGDRGIMGRRHDGRRHDDGLWPHVWRAGCLPQSRVSPSRTHKPRCGTHTSAPSKLGPRPCRACTNRLCGSCRPATPWRHRRRIRRRYKKSVVDSMKALLPPTEALYSALDDERRRRRICCLGGGCLTGGEVRAPAIFGAGLS